MSAARDLPARPSLDSLRKQAKRLVRDAAGGSGEAAARIHAQLPRASLPLSNRDAQLVIAREYGFAGWHDLTAEVERRLGHSIDQAGARAKVAIHDRDDDRLRALLAEYPDLVSWRDESGETLFSSTTPYALDVSDPERERLYARPDAAAILIDAGIQVESSTWEYLIGAGAAGMLKLLARKQILPSTLPILAALGDEGAIAARLSDSPDAQDKTVIARALRNACRFKHSVIALQLLDRAIGLDPDLGRRIDRWDSRQAFVDFLAQHPGSHWSGGPTEARDDTLWQAFVIRQLTNALDHDDLPAFRRWLEHEPWVLEPSFVHVQVGLIERGCWQKTGEPFISELLGSGPALLRVEPPPKSSALMFALDYGHASFLPLLTRVWPLPNDLPFAAGTGNAAGVGKWFDATGQPALGPLSHHHPASNPDFKRADLGWEVASTQQVLDIALAWACLNHHFDIASFLLEHGANVNTNWGTHEAASILHEAAVQGNEPAVRFLIDRGADLTMKDYRYESNAEGWARYGSGDERMANLLAAAAARTA